MRIEVPVAAPAAQKVEGPAGRIAGVLIGYLTSEPIAPGVTYDVLGSSDVTDANKPTYIADHPNELPGICHG